MSTPQANSKNCFVCGLQNPSGLHLRFYTTAPGQVEAQYTVCEHFEGYPGVVHGGIVAAMLDEATGRSHMGGDTPRFMFTAKLEIRYRQNVPIGEPLRLVGIAGKSRGRTATAAAYIYNAQGEVLAEAEALLVDVPQDKKPDADLDAMGWRVYSDAEIEGQKG
jgi:acyl-coenzyme A thioesterase PaaI-like protein